MSDEAEFETLAARHRRELHVHCYRMLGSFDEAEDALQEALLRAWRGYARADDSQPRAWLYRIATNVCLDLLRQRQSRQAVAMRSVAEVPWLQPYPDRLLDGEGGTAPRADEPEAIAVDRETISLAFIAALQVLPPRQRATLIARDVLGWSAKDTASLLGTTVGAANSALQRARETMHRHLPAERAQWTGAQLSAAERDMLTRFIEAHERCDMAAAIAVAAEDLRVTMPPNPWVFEGAAEIAPLLAQANGMGDWRLLPVRANRMPAAASFLRRPGDTQFRSFKIDVLRVRDGAIAEITTFGDALFPAFGLPPVLREAPDAR